jgi:hypothetical protein
MLTFFAGRAVERRYEDLGARVVARVAQTEDVGGTLDELDIELDPQIRELVKLLLRPRVFVMNRLALKFIRNSDIFGAWNKFGATIATRVRLGWIYLREFERLAKLEEGERVEFEQIPTAAEIRERFVYNQDIPVELSTLLVQSRRATPALLALVYLIDHPRELTSRVTHALAEQFESAARASLEAVAIHGAHVDPEVLSVEPITLQELEERHARRVESFFVRLESGELTETPDEQRTEAR